MIRITTQSWDNLYFELSCIMNSKIKYISLPCKISVSHTIQNSNMEEVRSIIKCDVHEHFHVRRSKNMNHYYDRYT